MPLCHMHMPPSCGSFDATGQGRGASMRIGIVVDSACDVPADFIRDEQITILPVTVQIGNAVLADMRNEDATLNFLSGDTAAQAYNAETTPFTVQQVHDLFL